VALKGAGRTAYSRGGDGRAALANAVREFFAPAFLEACGVPSVATLAVVASDASEDAIMRDEWYDGKVGPKKPGIVTRVAPTFLRFGSLQLAAKRQGFDGLVQVARFALSAIARLEEHDDGSTAYLGRIRQPISPWVQEKCFFGRRHEPSCARSYASLADDQVLRCLLQRVTMRTAALIAAWMANGFAHGVMNTDNLSILGITVDLNVFGFFGTYNPAWAPNHIDDSARYAFGTQNRIAKWNLQRLADALTGTIFKRDREHDARTWAATDHGRWLSASIAEGILEDFDARFEACQTARMEIRLGFPATGSSSCSADQSAPACLSARWLKWLQNSGADYPRASRGLAELNDVAPVQAEALKLAEHAGAGVLSSNGVREASADNELATFLQIFFKAHQNNPHWRAIIRSAVPAFAPRTHILREAARLVQFEDRRGHPFLEELLEAMHDPFNGDALPLGATWDSGVQLSVTDSTADNMRVLLRGRLQALPLPEMQQLRTSCGAQ